MEDHAIILDYLPLGHVAENNSNYKNKPVAQAIVTEEFTLLELAPKPNADIEIHNITVYVMFDNVTPFDIEWWNAPYKAGDTDEIHSNI